MATNYYDDEEDDDTTTDVVGQLRKVNRALEKRAKELEQELSGLKTQTRQRTVKDVLQAKGLNPKIAAFIPQDIETNFRDIISSTEELFQDFRDLAKSKKTPLDFGLAIKQDPNSALQITARNKQKNIKSF